MIGWSDEVDEILAGDLAAGLAYCTPAGGVVIMPIAPLGLRDRGAGTVTVTSSYGLPRKLDRIRRNPSVALAYHTREHGYSNLPHFVLVQGSASVGERPDRAWLESITPQVEQFLGPRSTGPVGWLMAVYNWQRVAITVHIDRVIVFEDLTGGDTPTILGSALPTASPAPQSAPAKGTAPRVDPRKVAAHVAGLPHTLLGWIGTDGLPMVVPVTGATADDTGVSLATPSPQLLPPGGRRAGLTSHAFRAHLVGQEQRVHTGWLEVGQRGVRYAPHTKTGYRMPPSKPLFNLAAGLGTRAGLRKAKKLGLTG
jgi:hypothetical protein